MNKFAKKILGLIMMLVIGNSLNAQGKRRPNIVFIMSDDHGYQAVSAYGHGLNKTPNIDRLAKEGVLFTRATVTNSLCAPSRAVMLTGKHSFINGKVDNKAVFDWNQPNFPKLLQSVGYQTAMVGKIHMDGLPQGFDYSAVLPGQGDYYNPDFIINGKRQRIPGYVTDITTKLVLEWLDGRNKDQPFCVLYHQKAPHREWLPALRHLKMYTGIRFPEPATLFDTLKGRGKAAQSAEMNLLQHMNWAGDSKIRPQLMDELGILPTIGWDKRAYFNNMARMDSTQKQAWRAVYDPINEDFKSRYAKMSPEELMRWRYQRYMQDYMGTVAAVDDGVGHLLDYLKENGLEENTIVVYTSDQGFYLGEHGWFDKRFMYEPSLRTPLLVRFPQEIKAGVKKDALVQNLDFAPTFLDYAGVPIPKDMQGKSFRNIMSGKDDNWRDAIYYTFYEYPSVHMVKRHYGIRTDRYKLIHFYYDIDEWELYDLVKDPQEMKNLYQDPEYASIRKLMHQKLATLRKGYGDSDANDLRFIGAAKPQK